MFSTLRKTLNRRLSIHSQHIFPSPTPSHKNTLSLSRVNYSTESDATNDMSSLAAQRALFLKGESAPIATADNVAMETITDTSEEEVRMKLYLNESSFASDYVRIDHKRGVRFITLTRESALNALNHTMVKQLLPIYRAYQSDPTTNTIILKSDSKKAFCAGGDIVDIVKSKNPTFFADEYKLDQLIATLSKPHLAFWDGIVMGGGVGISVHGAFRIATENALFAMPEVGIGFFPDVGGTYFLPRLANNYGYFLALTGKRLKGREILNAGIANYFVPSNKIGPLQQLLVRMDSNSPVDVRNCIRYVHADCSNIEAPKDAEQIAKIFDPKTHPTVESIMEDLEKIADKEEWAAAALKSMKRASPTSLKVTYEALKRGQNLEFKDCFKMELVIAEQMLKKHDFAEGVRALLVDKDNKPTWEPSTLAEVTDKDIAFYFNEMKLLGLDETKFDYETLNAMFAEDVQESGKKTTV